eukprot:scaffold15056_cov101-Isochrysis_galbana.AAC.6
MGRGGARPGVAGVRAHDDPRPLLQLRQPGPQQLVLLVVCRVHKLLRDGRVGRRLRLRHRRLKLRRTVPALPDAAAAVDEEGGCLLGGPQIAGRQLADRFGPGCREQERLSGGGQGGEDGLELGFEAHVEHAVGLVEHHDAARECQRDGLLAQQVDQPARRRDEQCRLELPELGQLRPEGRAAVHDARGEAAQRSPLGALHADLGRQLARWSQAERAHSRGAAR